MEKDFLNFIIQAKKATYASQGDDASVKPLLDGSRQLEFENGDFLYRDIYFGMSNFVGQELVYYHGKPLWSMAYSGGVVKPYNVEFIRDIYSFLRKAMRNITLENPYRGPKEFIEEEFIYRDSNTSNISEFIGNEIITYKNEIVYRLNYTGGFIR
jgi:hypothetical protein